MDNINISISGSIQNEFTIQNGDILNFEISGVAPFVLEVEGTPTVPVKLSQLQDDSTHRFLTDDEITYWNSKEDALGYIPVDKATNNIPYGYAGLDELGLISPLVLPSGSLKYKATWDASTNTPFLINPNTLEIGNIYLVSVPGSQFGFDFQVADWAVYGSDGYIEKLQNFSNMVTSVNGKIGNVHLDASDISGVVNSRYVTDNERDALSGVINPISIINPVADILYVNNAISGIAYTNSIPMPETVGGLEAGSTFTNVTVPQMFNQLLYPYQYPSFASFSIAGQTSPIEVGDSILSNRTFNWSDINATNININSISILDVTSNTTIASTLPNTGSYVSTYNAITKTSSTSNTFRISALNSKSQTLTKDYIVTWLFKKYYGESILTTLDQSSSTSLRVNLLSSSFAGMYSFVGGGYKYFVWPTILGTATTFKDISNNLAVPMQPVYTISITNSFSVAQNYYVYRTTNILGGSITIAVS